MDKIGFLNFIFWNLVKENFILILISISITKKLKFFLRNIIPKLNACAVLSYNVENKCTFYKYNAITGGSRNRKKT